jgi:hypothetical protein
MSAKFHKAEAELHAGLAASHGKGAYRAGKGYVHDKYEESKETAKEKANKALDKAEAVKEKTAEKMQHAKVRSIGCLRSEVISDAIGVDGVL